MHTAQIIYYILLNVKKKKSYYNAFKAKELDSSYQVPLFLYIGTGYLESTGKELIMENSERKQNALDLCEKYWISGRGERFAEWGVPFVMGKREGYKLWDIDGHEVYDLHLNGGTYNLGHRNPEILARLKEGIEVKGLDIGNHHFPSEQRGILAKMLVEAAPGDDYSNVVFVNSGAEAIDLAIRTIRHATGKRKIVSFDVAYHGYGTTAATQLGSQQSAKFFNCEASESDSVTIKWNDLEDAKRVLSDPEVAGLIAECCPASAGFLIPDKGYLEGLYKLCKKYDVPWIADEVQVGMGRSGNGQLWACEGFGISPDILVTAKALGAGILPIGAIIIKEKYSDWVKDKPWAWTSTTSGSELACYIAEKSLEIVTRKETMDHVKELSQFFQEGFEKIMEEEPFLVKVRQMGVIFGLVTAHPQGGMFFMRHLYENGLWAIVSSLDEAVVQFKPGLLLPMEDAKRMLDIVKISLRQSKEDAEKSAGVVSMY